MIHFIHIIDLTGNCKYAQKIKQYQIITWLHSRALRLCSPYQDYEEYYQG